MRIVHFSVTPLAGGPYRLSSAIRRHMGHDVRLIDLKRWGRFWHDVVFCEEQELAFELAESADIIHLYNSIDLDNSMFAPINFRQLWNKGIRFIRHFRSEPVTVARSNRQSIQELLACPLPSLVIGQYPERFYPNARVVRNNLPIYDPAYLPSDNYYETDVLFTPTKKSAVIEERWNTKGAPETKRLMKQVAARTGCTIKTISGMPIADVLKAKSASYMILDDMVTGSYHMSGMEGLSMAKPTVCYLDNRTDHVIRELTGAMHNPFVNVSLDNAQSVIEQLLRDRSTGLEIGKLGRLWLETYWDEKSIAKEFDEIYSLLLDDPSKIRRQKSLAIENSAQKFFAITKFDLEYHYRAKRLWPFQFRILRKVRNLNLKFWNRVKKKTKDLFRFAKKSFFIHYS